MKQKSQVVNLNSTITRMPQRLKDTKVSQRVLSG
jgi:hypothetical protein